MLVSRSSVELTTNSSELSLLHSKVRCCGSSAKRSNLQVIVRCSTRKQLGLPLDFDGIVTCIKSSAFNSFLLCYLLHDAAPIPNV